MYPTPNYPDRPLVGLPQGEVHSDFTMAPSLVMHFAKPKLFVPTKRKDVFGTHLKVTYGTPDAQDVDSYSNAYYSAEKRYRFVGPRQIQSNTYDDPTEPFYSIVQKLD